MKVPAILPLDEIIGRSDEVARIDVLLRQARLVSITGLGGIGKSRVAGEIAQCRAIAGEDVAFVDLATVIRTDLVADRIAQVLGISESAGATANENVVLFFSGRRSVLVLDSFEHVLGAASLVRDLLAAAPELSILVTSRLALRIAGEREFPLGPLPLPADASWPAVSASAAGQLFIREAERIGSVVGPDDASGVARICVHLGGVPLGIELAAARTRLFSPAVIAERLDHEVPTLSRGATPRDPLTAVLSWTVDLLDETERCRFVALGVLSGRFGLSTLVAIWDTDEPLDLLDTLLRLGLVRRADDQDRFELLPPVREFARRQLHERGEEQGTMARLSRWAFEQATLLGASLHGRDQTAAIAVIQAEMTTLRSVIDWQTALDPPAAAEIVVALNAYWFRTAMRDGLEIASTLIGKPRISEAMSARLLDIMATTERPLIGPEGAIEHATMMLDIALRLDDHWLQMKARLLLGLACGPEVALAELLAAADLARDLDAPGDALLILSNLGVVQLNAGDFDAALETLGSAIQTSRTIGDQFAIAMNLANLAEALLMSGRIEDVGHVVDEASRIFRDLPPGRGIAFVTAIAAATAVRQGRVHDASAKLVEAARIVEATGGWDERSMLLDYAALIRCGEGRLREAASLLGAVDQLREEAGEAADAIRSVVGCMVAAALEDGLHARAPEAIAAGRELDPIALIAALATPASASPAISGRHGRLSPREIEVLNLVVHGATDPDIADKLFISPKTASVHVSNLRDKLGAESRVELALEGRRLLDSPSVNA